jgi:hypothetical protein
MRRAALLAVAALAIAPASASADGGTVACEHVHESDRTFVSQAPAPADWAARLDILRRAPTAEETAGVQQFARSHFLRILYANSVRLLRTDPDGTKWYFFLGKPRVYRYPKRCLERLPLHQQHVLIRGQERAIKQAKEPAMGIWQVSPDGSAGGAFGSTLRILLNKPTGGATGTSHGSTVYSVVPDGVATVDLTFPNGATATATVNDNFWTTHFAGGPEKAWAKTTVWRAADGSVIKTLRSR